MKSSRLLFCITLLLLLGVAAGFSQELSLKDQVIERNLDNGLKVLMVQRPQAPLIRCILAYRVGSVNERPGITGISHFLEHMMFKGTHSVGVKPGTLKQDMEYDRQIDEIMAKVVEEQSKVRGRDEEQIMKWKAEVSDIIAKQREETMIGEELWGAYQKAGGTGINASTGNERTQYYVTLPKNKIELFLALEADRMVNPVFREFYAERDVIVEERRMSENRPGFFFREQLNAAFYAASPYSWTVLGWMSDVSRVTKEEMIEYREKYYRPNNATLVMAGDIDVEHVMGLVEKYFGKIKPNAKSPRVRTEEPYPEYYKSTVGPDFDAPYIEKRVYGKAATSPSVQLMFHIPPLWHEDVAVLDMLGRVMSARTGEMYMTMVTNDEHASRVSARASTSMYDGSFTLSASVKEKRNKAVISSDQIEKKLWTYIEDAKTKPFDEKLLQKVKNSVEASFLRGLQGTRIASALGRMACAYEWQFLEEQYKQKMAVTPEDMMRVAKKYLVKNHSLTGVLERDK